MSRDSGAQLLIWEWRWDRVTVCKCTVERVEGMKAMLRQAHLLLVLGLGVLSMHIVDGRGGRDDCGHRRAAGETKQLHRRRQRGGGES